MQHDKNDYRGVLAGLERIIGNKVVDSEATTVKKVRTSDSAESAALHCSRPVYSGLGCKARASR
jgi:hypothetical protein